MWTAVEPKIAELWNSIGKNYGRYIQCMLVPEMSIFSHTVDPFQPGVELLSKFMCTFMKLALSLIFIPLFLPLEALGLKRVFHLSSAASPCVNFAPCGLSPIISPSEDLARKLAELGSQEKKLDWKKWAFKAVPVFLALLGASTLIGAGTILPLLLPIAIVMALIIHDGIMEIIVPVRDKIAGNSFKEVASDGLLGLGRDLGGKVAGGLLGLGTTLASGLVISTLVMAYRNKDGRISNENLSNRVENKMVEGKY